MNENLWKNYTTAKDKLQKSTEDVYMARKEIPRFLSNQHLEILQKSIIPISNTTLNEDCKKRQLSWFCKESTKCPTSQEREQLFQEVDELIQRNRQLKQIQQVKQNLNLNETQAVLFGKPNEDTTLNDTTSFYASKCNPNLTEQGTVYTSKNMTVDDEEGDDTYTVANGEESSAKQNDTYEITTNLSTAKHNQSKRKTKDENNLNYVTTEETENKDRDTNRTPSGNNKKAKKSDVHIEKVDDTDSPRKGNKGVHHSMVLPEVQDPSVGTPIRPRRTSRRRSTVN